MPGLGNRKRHRFESRMWVRVYLDEGHKNRRDRVTGL